MMAAGAWSALAQLQQQNNSKSGGAVMQRSQTLR